MSLTFSAHFQTRLTGLRESLLQHDGHDRRQRYARDGSRRLERCFAFHGDRGGSDKCWRARCITRCIFWPQRRTGDRRTGNRGRRAIRAQWTDRCLAHHASTAHRVDRSNVRHCPTDRLPRLRQRDIDYLERTGAGRNGVGIPAPGSARSVWRPQATVQAHPELRPNKAA